MSLDGYWFNFTYRADRNKNISDFAPRQAYLARGNCGKLIENLNADDTATRDELLDPISVASSESR